MGDEIEELSIEETNKLRIAAGLKPLNLEKPAAKNAEDNYKEYKKKENDAVVAKQIAENLEKAKTRRELNKRLVGATLADDDEELSTSDWIKKQKNSLPVNEPKTKKAKIKSYTQDSLDGLTVAHAADQFQEGTGEILVLKDSNILDNEEDQLESVSLAELNRTYKNLERKKKKGYSAYNDSDKGILYQYDDEMETDTFVIGAKGIIDGKSNESHQSDVPVGESLSSNRLAISDYYTKEEIPTVKFKKTKKKKRSTRRALEADEEGVAATSTDQSRLPSPPIREQTFQNSNSIRDINDMNFVDDDDLQQMISRARKVAQRKREKIIDEIEMPDVEPRQESDSEDNNRIVLSEASEFVRNLNMKEEQDFEDDMETAQVPIADQVMHTIKEESELEANSKMTPPDNNEEMKVDDTLHTLKLAPITEEPLVSSGLAATLKLLSQKNLIEKVDPSFQNDQRKKTAWLADRRKQDELDQIEKERIREENRSKGEAGKRAGPSGSSRYEQRDRIQKAIDKFKDYTPVVDLKYHDESGRELNQKEAFRQLSHKFHGMKSGKGKREKQMRKQEEELKTLRAAEATSVITQRLMEQTREQGQAHVVLSKGKKAMPVFESMNSAIPLVKEVKTPTLPVKHASTASSIAEQRPKMEFKFQQK